MSKNPLTDYNKQVKRINERIADIGRTFGTESYQYKSIESAIKSRLNQHKDLYHYSKSGNIAIPTSEKFKNITEMRELVRQLEKRWTRGQIKDNARRKHKAETGEELKESEVIPYIKKQGNLREFMDNHVDFRYENEHLDFFFKNAKKKEYDFSDSELREFLDWYTENERAIESGNNPDTRNPFDEKLTVRN